MTDVLFTDATLLDLEAGALHAGLTTLDLSALATRPATRLGIETKTVLEGMLERGFTTVRDAGGLDRGIQESLDAGLIQGPGCSGPGGYSARPGAMATPIRPPTSRTCAPVTSRARSSHTSRTAPPPCAGRCARS